MPGEATVWDSSVLIPLILPRSKSSALYTRLDDAGWIVAATPAILQEVREKLETKSSLRRWLGLDDKDTRVNLLNRREPRVGCPTVHLQTDWTCNCYSLNQSSHGP